MSHLLTTYTWNHFPNMTQLFPQIKLKSVCFLQSLWLIPSSPPSFPFIKLGVIYNYTVTAWKCTSFLPLFISFFFFKSSASTSAAFWISLHFIGVAAPFLHVWNHSVRWAVCFAERLKNGNVKVKVLPIHYSLSILTLSPPNMFCIESNIGTLKQQRHMSYYNLSIVMWQLFIF